MGTPGVLIYFWVIFLFSLLGWNWSSVEDEGIQPCHGMSLSRGPECQRCHPFLLVSVCWSKDRKVLRGVLRVRSEWSTPCLSYYCVDLTEPSSSLFLSSVSSIGGHTLRTTIETRGRSSPRDSLHGRLPYRVGVSSRLTRVFVSPFKLDRIQRSYRSEVRVGVWGVPGKVPLSTGSVV